MKHCACGRTFSEADSTGEWCFRCKLDGLKFNFVGGGGYGREQFHNETNAGFAREIVEGAALRGDAIEKKSTRAELI